MRRRWRCTCDSSQQPLDFLRSSCSGTSDPAVSAQSEAVPAGIRVGDVIRVTFPATISGALFKCTVTALRDGFVRCQEEEPGAGQNQGSVTWHNLRLAWEVAVTPQDALAIR